MSFYLSNPETRPTGQEPVEFIDTPVVPLVPPGRPMLGGVLPSDDRAVDGGGFPEGRPSVDDADGQAPAAGTSPVRGRRVWANLLPTRRRPTL